MEDGDLFKEQQDAKLELVCSFPEGRPRSRVAASQDPSKVDLGVLQLWPEHALSIAALQLSVTEPSWMLCKARFSFPDSQITFPGPFA